MSAKALPHLLKQPYLLRHSQGVELVAGKFDCPSAGTGFQSLVELEGWDVRAQHRHHLSAAGAGVGDGGRHGSSEADGGIPGAMPGRPRTPGQNSPLKACCRRDFFISSKAASLRS